jgi:hypothetical protein
VSKRVERYLIRETAGWLLGTPSQILKGSESDVDNRSHRKSARTFGRRLYVSFNNRGDQYHHRRRGSRPHRMLQRHDRTVVSRNAMVAGMPAASATRLRTGQGWDEGPTGDVLGEILHAYSKSRSRRVTDSIQRKSKQVWGRRREPRLLTMRNTHPGKRTGRGQRMLAEAISPPIQISEEL